jgi:pantetheine-phosphate adenylyltransferase
MEANVIPAIVCGWNIKDLEYDYLLCCSDFVASFNPTNFKCIKTEPISERVSAPQSPKSKAETYRIIAVGGTFDRLHYGHKVLLSIAAWLASEQLICGVADGRPLEGKTLGDLILPVSVRIASVVAFLQKIKKGIKHQVIPITDNFGPTIDDPKIEAIVCSRETIKGCEWINCQRALSHFNPLAIFPIDLLSNNSPNELNLSTKISSSFLRGL